MKNRFGIEIKRGMRVTYHHPRGGTETGTVLHVSHAKHIGRVSLDSGASCGVDDVIEATMPHILSARTCASSKALQTIKDVTPADAWLIRHLWRTVENRKAARAAVDKVLCTHGVEYLGQSKRTVHHIYYCNAGDAYAGTILFAGNRIFVGCWGDLIEGGRIMGVSQ